MSTAPVEGTYADGGYPDTEHLEPVDLSGGFKVGDVVEFVEDWADDVPKGRRGTIEAIDNHPTMPLRVDIHQPDGRGMIFGVPVKPSEVAKVSPDAPAAVSAPEAPSSASDGGAEPEAVAA